MQNEMIAERFFIQERMYPVASVFTGLEVACRRDLILFASPSGLGVEDILPVTERYMTEIETYEASISKVREVVLTPDTPEHQVWLVIERPLGHSLIESLARQSISFKNTINLLKSLGCLLFTQSSHGLGLSLTAYDVYCDEHWQLTGVVAFPKTWIVELDRANVLRGGKTSVTPERMRYMAPEELQESDCSAEQTMMYRLGVIAYRLFYGSELYEGPINVLLRQILTGPSSQLPLVEADVTVSVKSSVQRLLADLLNASPDRRPTWDQVAHQLDQMMSELDDQDKPKPTLINGRYQIERVLGRGGFGVVYLVIDQKNFGQRVALKVLNHDMLSNQEVLKRFEVEAKIQSQLNHDHIVKMLDYGFNKLGQPYLVSEYLKGDHLGAFLKKQDHQRLNPISAVGVTISVTEALEEAHECGLGIVHRDIKPENIFVLKSRQRKATSSQRLRVKLLDFGISKLIDVGPGSLQTGQFMGTVEYMSPEQCEDTSQVDYRSDYYSLGLVLYEMLTGTKPFKCKTIFQFIQHHQNTLVPRITPDQLRQNAPCNLDDVVDELNKVIAWMTAKRRDDRPSNATELIDRLSACEEALLGRMLYQVSPAQAVDKISPQSDEPQSSQPYNMPGLPSLDPDVKQKDTVQKVRRNNVHRVKQARKASSMRQGWSVWKSLLFTFILVGIGLSYYYGPPQLMRSLRDSVIWVKDQASLIRTQKSEVHVMKEVHVKRVTLSLRSQSQTFQANEKIDLVVKTDPISQIGRVKVFVDPKSAGWVRGHEFLQLTSRFKQATLRACVKEVCSEPLTIFSSLSSR